MRWRGALLVLSCAGCQPIDLDPTEFACGSDSDCGDGTTCVEGRCGIEVFCGDGIRQEEETCDDGRPTASGGCVECEVAFGWQCRGEIGEQSACEKQSYAQISAGARHVCGLTMDGFVECGGNGDLGQTQPPNELGPFTLIRSRFDHSCAIRQEDERLVCWGNNKGRDGTTDANQATVPRGTPAVADMGLGNYHTCVKTKDGFARCWGEINSRPLGTENPIPTDLTIEEIEAGSFHTCVRDTAKTIRCWGDSDKVDAPAGAFDDLGVGYFHSCAVRDDGTISCWGRDAPDIARTSPPTDPTPFVQVVAGHYHNCALTAEDRPRCSGNPRVEDDFGQQNPAAGAFVELAAGARFTCGLRPDRTLECWGAIEPTRE